VVPTKQGDFSSDPKNPVFFLVCGLPKVIEAGRAFSKPRLDQQKKPVPHKMSAGRFIDRQFCAGLALESGKEAASDFRDPQTEKWKKFSRPLWFDSPNDGHVC
jgi:hypothetical protein